MSPEILRLSTTVRRACSAALLVGSTPGCVMKPHRAGHNLSRLAQVLAVRLHRVCPAARCNA